MSTNEPPQTRRAHTRREVCVVIAVHEHAQDLRACLDSLARHTQASIPRIRVEPSAAAVDRALARLAPADVVILDEPCRLTPGWLERMRATALADTNTATVSALADAGSELALAPSPETDAEPSRLAERLAANTLALHPRLTRAVGPCVYVRRDARPLDGAVTGTQVHVLELILALARTDALRLRLLVRVQRIDRETLRQLRELPAPQNPAAADLDAAMPGSAVFHRPQQTFSPGDVALALSLGERFVISQLDLIAYRNPGYFADAGSWQDYRRASRHGLSAAERVVVFSDHTRRELLADALVEDARIRVVPPGLDHGAAAEPVRPAALDSAGTEPPADGFLLCLGTDFLHKNRLFALRLLAALRANHGWEGGLVLAGTHIPHGSSLELERALLQEQPQLGPSVLDLGPVSEAEKTWLIAHAGAVVYPSVYEGFGLVPFESALSGVPCVFAPQA